MQEAKETAAKPESERLRHFGLELQRCIVELKLLERIAKRFVLIRLDRIKTGKDGRFDLLEPRQGSLRGLPVEGHGIAHFGSLELLDARDDESDLPGRQRLALRRLRREDTHLLTQDGDIGGHQPDLVLGAQSAVEHSDQHHHTDIIVEPGVDDQSLQRRLRIAFGRRDPGDHGFENVVDAHAGLGTGRNRIRRIDADDLFDLDLRLLGVGLRQIHLVEHRHDLDTQFDGGVAIGHRLGFYTLGGIDHQQGALAG